MRLDAAVMLVGLVLNTVLLALLLWRRVFRVLPIFVAYMAYSFFSVAANLILLHNTRGYVLFWSVATAIDTLFYLGVLVELENRVARYNEATPLPEALVFALFAIVSAPIWLLTQWRFPPGLTLAWRLNFRALQWTAILELAAILTIAWLTNRQNLRWPERELRLVMGMGAWAMVQLCVLIAHEHGLVRAASHWLDLLTPIAAMGTDIYWVHYFWLDPSSGADCQLDKSAGMMRSRKAIPAKRSEAEEFSTTGGCER